MPVFIVHAIDTEGPFFETLGATFQRLVRLVGVQLKPTIQNLRNLQSGKVYLSKKQKKIIKTAFSSSILNYHKTWFSIKKQVKELTSNQFRTSLVDSSGKGWVYNWFCVDHVGFRKNPRKRIFGFHKIFDKYKRYLNDSDEIQFHHHPINVFKDASLCSTKIFGNDCTMFEILARRIIERNWYPSVYRPGFHCERNDTNWFLEQFIPFDLSNQSTRESTYQPDLQKNRFGDWSRAPRTWVPYHPDHDDYQRKGNCRRWIGRILNLGTRLRNIKKADIKNAFKEAQNGKSVILAIASHDYRDMRADLTYFKELLRQTVKDFPQVNFYFSGARQAFRRALKLKKPSKPFRISVSLEKNKLTVKTNQKTFGPQPFLALKTKGKKVFHENFDIIKPFHHWSYIFDENSIPMRLLDTIGIAAINSYGSIVIKKITISTNTWKSYKI